MKQVQVFDGDGVKPKGDPAPRLNDLKKLIDIECESFEEAYVEATKNGETIKKLDMRGLKIKDMEDMFYLEGFNNNRRIIVDMLQVSSDNGQAVNLSRVRITRVETIIDHDAIIFWTPA